MFGPSLLDDAREAVRNVMLRTFGRLDPWCNEALERLGRCETVGQIEDALEYRLRTLGLTTQQRMSLRESIKAVDALVGRVAGDMGTNRQDIPGT